MVVQLSDIEFFSCRSFSHKSKRQDAIKLVGRRSLAAKPAKVNSIEAGLLDNPN